MDWAKCYDRLPLELFQLIAEELEMPTALVGPMLSMYRAERAIHHEYGIGKFRVPVCGLPPGCPGAVD